MVVEIKFYETARWRRERGGFRRLGFVSI